MEEVKAKLGTLISEKKRGARPDNGASWEQAFQSTFDCLDRLGIGNDQVSERLRVIHIAGTKVRRKTSLGARGPPGYRVSLPPMGADFEVTPATGA